jgi:phosphoribosyl-ATP pyrophosphohydrolase/phosphoribosyl-AMP cyclohydrolase
MPNALVDSLHLDFAKGNGLVTVVTQDVTTGAVLMVAHADTAAVELSITTGEMHYFSRSRGPWHKGATSGNTQQVVTLSRDCDCDSLLARVRPAGPACHTGTTSCFGEAALSADAFGALGATIRSRAESGANPGASYTAALLGDRNRRLKKLGEEAAELIAACADGDAQRAAAEAADLIYHIGVALQACGSSLDDARAVLFERRRQGA